MTWRSLVGDIEVDLSKCVGGANGVEQLSGNLCAVRFRRVVDLNLGKRAEVTGCGSGSLQVKVDLCFLSSSGQDLNVDVNKRVETGKVLHRASLAEYPWTVLDPTVNVVCRVDDLVTSQHLLHSRNVDLCKIDVASSCRAKFLSLL